jgi:hypothetical protein
MPDLPEKREIRTEDEIRALILSEVRRNPRCSNVKGVYITRVGKSNWDFGFQFSGATHDPTLQGWGRGICPLAQG